MSDERFSVLCVGAGHVGIPLALRLWSAGHTVATVDIDTGKIDALREGRMPFVEEGCDEILERAAGDPRFLPLTYSDDRFAAAVREAEYVVMTLGTPMGTDYTFRFDQYFAVLDAITPHLSPGVTLIVRSTVAPHFTRNVVATRIALDRDWIPGTDFFVTFCPERLLEGRALRDIKELPEIIGADDPESARRAAALFSSHSPDKPCVHVSTVEAELAKLYLNAFRYTLFGLANEFALVSEEYGADMYRVLAAANGNYPRGGIPRPGPSRGPCLGKDTATLAFSSACSLITHAAIKTNEGIVLHATSELRARLGTLLGHRVVILGRAFKADTDDIRDNLTDPLVNLLDREGAVTAVYDPLVAQHGDTSVLRGADAVVLMVGHAAFREWTDEDLMALCGRSRDEVFVFDFWNIWPWADRIFGRGSDREDSVDRRGGLADAGRGAETDRARTHSPGR